MQQSAASGSRRQDSESIVVGVDGTPESDAAVDWAIRESQATGRRILLVHVTSIGEELAAGVVTLFGVQDPSSYPQEVLDRYTAECRRAGAPVTVVQTEGSTAKSLADVSQGAAMLVIGFSGQSAPADFARGSLIEGILRRAQCPVVVVKKELGGQGPSTLAGESG